MDGYLFLIFLFGMFLVGMFSIEWLYKRISPKNYKALEEHKRLMKEVRRHK